MRMNDLFMDSFSSSSIKILVPNSTAGMIIGKGGSYIRLIKENSGAFVQISQKCTDFSSSERCITIIGPVESIRKACVLILNKIFGDDVSSSSSSLTTSGQESWLLTSTSSSSSSSSLTSSTSSFFSPTSSIFSPTSSFLSSSFLSTTSTSSSNSSESGILSSATSPPRNSINDLDTAQIIESILLVLKLNGHGESEIMEITAAMSILAKYGVLGAGLGIY